MGGPILGQVIFSAVGFEKTFYATGLILAMPLVLEILYIPNRINLHNEEETKDESQDNSQD